MGGRLRLRRPAARGDRVSLRLGVDCRERRRSPDTRIRRFRRASAARGRRRSDRAHSRRLHVRSQGDDGDHAAAGCAVAASWRVSGLRAARDRLPAFARTRGAVRQRLPGDAAGRPALPRLAGVDASHAWLAVYCPGIGWIDVDPTNNMFPSTTHVTLAWGRDYADVSPVHGVILGGGRAHRFV